MGPVFPPKHLFFKIPMDLVPAHNGHLFEKESKEGESGKKVGAASFFLSPQNFAVLAQDAIKILNFVVGWLVGWLEASSNFFFFFFSPLSRLDPKQAIQDKETLANLGTSHSQPHVFFAWIVYHSGQR